MSAATGSARRRLSTITVDQAIAGASNVLIAVLAARILSTESFGLFGIVFLVYVTVQVGLRSLVCDPLLVHPQEAQTRKHEVLGTGCVLGVGAGLVVALAGLAAYAWDDRLGQALLVLAACLPLLALQDLGRYLAFATQRPSSAVVLDVTWLVLLLGAVAWLALVDSHSLTAFIAVWGGSGAVSGLLVLSQHRTTPPRLGLAWLRTTWRFSWRYLLASLSAAGAVLAGSFALGVISGPAALGAVVGATLTVRPFMTFQIAAIAAATTEVAHGDRDRASVLHHVRRTSGLTAAVAVVNTVILLLLPDWLGRVGLGDTWDDAKPLLLGTGVQIVLLGLITGPRAGMLGLRAVRRTFRIDIAGAVLLLVMTIAGAYVDGALGAVWAVAIGQALVTGVWWLVLLRHLSAGGDRWEAGHRWSSR